MITLKLFTSFLVLFLILLSILGCTNVVENSSETNAVTQIPPREPLEFNLSFPDGAPPLNQMAALNCVITSRETILKEVSITVNLPDSFELISGSLSWNGTIPAKGIVTVIESVVKSVQVGNWSINATGYITIEPGTYGGNFYIPIFVSVAEKTAEWDITPPWFRGLTPTVDTENRPPPATTTID